MTRRGEAVYLTYWRMMVNWTLKMWIMEVARKNVHLFKVDRPWRRMTYFFMNLNLRKYISVGDKNRCPEISQSDTFSEHGAQWFRRGRWMSEQVEKFFNEMAWTKDLKRCGQRWCSRMALFSSPTANDLSPLVQSGWCRIVYRLNRPL